MLGELLLRIVLGGTAALRIQRIRGAVLFLSMKRKWLLPVLALILAIAFSLLAAALVLDRLGSLPGRLVNSASNQTATEIGKVRDAFINLFHLQPKILVNETVVQQQTATAPELAIVSRDVEVTRDAVQTWWGSTKTIRLRSVYRIKAGFDLSQKFEVQVRGSEIVVDLPKAKILSIEPVSTNVEELRDGLWNKIQADDIEKEVNKMPEIARAKSNTLPDEAEETLKRLLAQKMDKQNIRVEFIPDRPSPK
jgi:Protein of unknown function (DUF4230)